jgi:hypothetical protein
LIGRHQSSARLLLDSATGCIAAIDSGLSKSAGDDLPVLEERAQQGTANVIQLEARGFAAKFAAIPRKVLFGEPQPLPDGLPPVTAFGFDLLPDPVRPWAEDIVETMQPSADFAGVTVMAGLGTVLGRKIGIRPQQNTCWTETANQWAMVIGRPGILKSPTIEACLAPVKALAAAAIADFKKQAHDHGIADKIAKMRAEAMEAQAKKAIRKDIRACRILIDSGFPYRRKSDSRFLLEEEAGGDGEALFDGFARAGDGSRGGGRKHGSGGGGA